MTNEHPYPQRRSVRLPHYDYSSAGAYFVTLCALNRKCVFGGIKNGVMNLSQTGKIVREEWLQSAKIRELIRLDEFIIMPNHLHGIIFLEEQSSLKTEEHSTRAHSSAPLPSLVRAPRSLSSMIAGFKATSTKRVNDVLNTPGVKLWQRNFFERVIRNEDALSKAREYIVNNPLKWELDKENPDHI